MSLQYERENHNHMVRIKPFAALRPPKEIVEEVAARPYDVLNSEEAKAEAIQPTVIAEDLGKAWEE